MDDADAAGAVTPPASTTSGGNLVGRRVDTVCRVAVVIPARNAAPWIGQQLAALHAERARHPGLGVIVVDDCSTDDTAAVVGRHPWVRVVSTGRPVGANAARNLGAAAADCDLLLFTDADDRVEPGWVAGLVDGLRHADLVGGTVVSMDRYGGEVPVEAEGLPRALGSFPYAVGCNMGVRRTVFERLGGFDPCWPFGGTEVEFCWRVGGHEILRVGGHETAR